MILNAFPTEFSELVSDTLKWIPCKTYNDCSVEVSQDFIRYSINATEIMMPYRIYYIDVPDAVYDNLNLQQQMILHCIYTRNCNGFVREKHLRALLSMDYDEWSIPFIVKVCDEYVMEILEAAYQILKEQDTERIKKFCANNKEMFCKSYSRMISYWNEFYRDRCYDFHQYIGRKLFRECFGYSRAMERTR